MRISDWSSDVCSSDLGFDAPFSADMIRPKRIAMFSSLRKLFKSERDPREARRPLWNAVVGAARAPHWYAEGGVPDTTEGRCEMISLALEIVRPRSDEDDEPGEDGGQPNEMFLKEMERTTGERRLGDIRGARNQE